MSELAFNPLRKQSEYITVLDENGVPTGEIRTRDEVHQQGLWHDAVLLLVFDDSRRMLMQQRAANKDKYPGMWDVTVAAHVLSSEYPINAGMREANEEMNFPISREIKVSDFIHIGSFRDQRIIREGFVEKQFYHVYAIKSDLSWDEMQYPDGEVQASGFKTYAQMLSLMNSGEVHPRNQWWPLAMRYLNLV